jgi:hypothetical protein
VEAIGEVLFGDPSEAALCLNVNSTLGGVSVLLCRSKGTNMQKAGGIIALIAGVLGVFAALLTLFVGGVGTAFQVNNAKLVVWLGWGGLLFSFLTIILGAVCISARSRMPAAFLIFAALGGVALGGTAVAVFMALALVGGVLAVFAARPSTDGAPRSSSYLTPNENSGFGDADEIIARYLKRGEQGGMPPGQSRSSSAPASEFGRRRQLGAIDR